MKLISYQSFIYSNYILSFALGFSAIVFYQNLLSLTILLGFATLTLLVASLSKQNTFPAVHLIPQRLVILTIFTNSIILSFLQYILKFSENVYLSASTLIVSALTLFILIITNLVEKK